MKKGRLSKRPEKAKISDPSPIKRGNLIIQIAPKNIK